MGQLEFPYGEHCQAKCRLEKSTVRPSPMIHLALLGILVDAALKVAEDKPRGKGAESVEDFPTLYLQ